jgi:putative methyltransferase (TIGR04325 family)
MVRPLLRGGRPVQIWRGTYERLSDVPARRAEYEAELIDEMVSTTSRALSEWREGHKPYLWHEPLALVAGAILRQRRIRVIDFGGGTGSGFAQLISSLPPSITIEYVVVDNQAACAAGRRVFGGETRIEFVTDVANIMPPVDLVYVNSVLQYIEDYAGTLRRLTALQPRYVFLARLAAGNVTRFASEQINIRGRSFPYWFLNLPEIVGLLDSFGYDLACDSFVDTRYDQSNLPASQRVERFRNVLFERRLTP